MSARCDLTELLVEQCAHCRPAPAAPPFMTPSTADFRPASHSFPARFGGRCAECEGGIVEGDPIRMTDDGAVHDDCAFD